MARTKVNTEEMDVQIENPNAADNEEVASSNKECMAEEVVITVEAKKVKVHVVEEVNCLVACIPYTLKKDTDYSIPSDVAAILCNAKKAYRI